MSGKTPQVREILSDRVRERRRILNMSQEALGEHLGVSQEVVSKIETGRRKVSAAHTQELLAFALKTTIAYLRGETDDPGSFVQEGEAMLDQIRQQGRDLAEKMKPFDAAYLRAVRAQMAPQVHLLRAGDLVDSEELSVKLMSVFDPAKHELGDALMVCQAMLRIRPIPSSELTRELLDVARRLREAGFGNSINHLITTAFERLSEQKK